jgi:hypothetical protein
VASQLRDTLATAGFTLPDAVQETDDPLEVFRLAASVSPDAAMTAQQLLTAFETRAIPTAKPTRGSADLIITACQTGRTVTIVSNNSGAAIAPTSPTTGSPGMSGPLSPAMTTTPSG